MFKNMGGNVPDGNFLIGSFSDTDIFTITKVCKKFASFYLKRLYIAFVKSLILKPNDSKLVLKIVQTSIKPALTICR